MNQLTRMALLALTLLGCDDNDAADIDAASLDGGPSTDAAPRDDAAILDDAAPLDDAASLDDAGEPDGAVPDGALPVGEDFAPLLAPILAETDVPALAALAFDADGILGEGVVGVRRAGDDTRATLGDRWHLGSDTKAMTATLVGLFVEEGALDWTTPLAELFPDFADMHPDCQAITLEQLLTMRGGFNDESAAYAELPPIEGFDTMTVASQRRALAELALSLPPDFVPGERYHYANLSYILVGAALEARSGEAWEDLMEDRLFGPLAMDACGFGPAGSAEVIDQPWAHLRVDGAYVGVAPGPAADNPPYLGPAGTVHCSLHAWQRFAAMHLEGLLGATDGFLLPETFATLHRPVGDYAMGFGVAVYGEERLIGHDGSNTMNYARVLLMTEPPIGILLTTNAGDESAVEAIERASAALATELDLTPLLMK